MKQKTLTTVVTDHRLIADTIAKALGATQEHEGYYLGGGYDVTWTNGCVIEATFKADQAFFLSSGMDSQLVYAHNFDFAMCDIDRIVGYEKSAQDIRQLDVIEALIGMSKTVVNAMSPDIEGELAFLNLRYYLGITAEVRRAWLPVLTKPKIVKAVERGPSNPEKYEQWLEAEIFDYLLASIPHEEDVAPKGEPHLVETTVYDPADEMTDGEPLPPFRECLFSYSDGPTLFNLPQLLVAAAAELDFTHEKTIQTSFSLYAKKLISYPFVKQNTIPSGGMAPDGLQYAAPAPQRQVGQAGQGRTPGVAPPQLPQRRERPQRLRHSHHLAAPHLPHP